MPETVSCGSRGLRNTLHCGCRVMLPQEDATAVSMGTNYPGISLLTDGPGRLALYCGGRRGRENTGTEIHSSYTFFFFANYGYSKMEKVKDCRLSSLHKSILTSVNGTILGGKREGSIKLSSDGSHNERFCPCIVRLPVRRLHQASASTALANEEQRRRGHLSSATQGLGDLGRNI